MLVKYKLFAFVSAIAVLGLAGALLTGTPAHDIIKWVVTQAMSTIVSVGIIGVLIDHFLREEINEQMEEAMLTVLFNTKESLARFSPKMLEQTILESVSVLNGEAHGERLFHANIQPYLGERYVCREDYRYFITFETAPPLVESSKLAFSSSDYFNVASEIAFTRSFGGAGAPSQVKIGFVYDHDSLEKMLPDPQWFLRDVIYLRPQERDILKGLSLPEMHEFVAHTMSPSVNVNDFPIDAWETTLLPDGFALSFDVPVGGAKESVRFHLQFQMPCLAGKKHFLVTLPEPTCGPEIVFTKERSQVNLEAITFFTRQAGAQRVISKLGVNKETWRVKVDDWVFPRSGVVFLWD